MIGILAAITFKDVLIGVLIAAGIVGYVLWWLEQRKVKKATLRIIELEEEQLVEIDEKVKKIKGSKEVVLRKLIVSRDRMNKVIDGLTAPTKVHNVEDALKIINDL